MKNISATKERGMTLMILASVVLSLFSVYYYVAQGKWLPMVVGLCLVAFLAFADLKPLKRVPVLFVLSYLVVNGLSAIWAMSGKFFLREFSKLFIAGALFLAVVLWQNFGKTTMQKIMTVLAGVGAVHAFLNVEAATTGLSEGILASVAGATTGIMGFIDGTRLNGVYGNANVSATVLAVSLFFALALLQDAESKKEKILYSVYVAFNAYALLMAFSMGGLTSFAISVIVYLIFAGKNRGGALVRMLEGAFAAVLWGFASYPFYNREGVLGLLPMLFLFAAGATVIALELKVADKLAAVLNQRQKLVIMILAAIVALGAAYIVVAYQLSGPYTFGANLYRITNPAPGTHVLDIEADGDVMVEIISRNESNIILGKWPRVYYGPADGATFTVPEGSKMCRFHFTAESGVTLKTAVLDGEETINLKYTLLPEFIAYRTQGLWANANAVRRTIYFKDGMKMFKQSPIIGNGLGSFETGATSVQDFFYESRYIHNHYIQVLLETGVIGLITFVGTLAAMVVLLWKRRKEENEFSWAYPALWAAMAMMMAHAVVEVSLSIIVVQCYMFLVFAMIVAGCPKAVEEKNEVEPVPTKKSKKRVEEKPKKPGSDYVIKGACVALPALFLLTLGMNMASKKLMSAPASSADDFLSRLEMAADMDLYEHNDAKLSYLYVTIDNPAPHRIQTANRMAAELEQVQSNSLPQGLTYYYLSTGQYEKALHAAHLATIYSATNASSWNAVISRLWNGFFATEETPLAGEQGAELREELVAYYETLKEHNRTSMETIALSTINQQFFTEILNLAEEPERYEEIAGKLMFCSWLNCDADENGTPDQISRLYKGVLQEGGAISMQAGGGVDIQFNAGNVSAVRATIECVNPEAVMLTDISTGVVQTPYEVTEESVTYLVLNMGDGTAKEGFRIDTAEEQVLDKIEISTHF